MGWGGLMHGMEWVGEEEEIEGAGRNE